MAAAPGTRKQAGFSLVELLVGLVLGAMLIAGVVSIYLAAKRSYVEVEQVAALTESARFAEQIVGNSLRHAGFFGEVTSSRVELDSELTPVLGDCDAVAMASAHDLSQFIFAADALDPEDVLGCIDDAYVPDDGMVNQVLVIKRVLPRPYTDSPRPNDPTADDGEISWPGPLRDDRTYVMTNSVGGLLFDGADTQPDINIGGAFPGGSAWEYQYEVFYIRRDPDADENTPPRLSRKFLSWNGAAMELATEDLADGVENLRLLFGFDTDGDGAADRYSSLADIGAGDWPQVVSVEVYMLVRSATKDFQYTDAKTYQVGDAVATPGDNYRRMVSFTSVSLRNLKLMNQGGS